MDGIDKPDNANITGEDEFNPEFGNIVVDGLATIYNLVVTGTATIAASLVGTITPAIDNTYNLGSALLRWATAYIVALSASTVTASGLVTALNISNYAGDGTGAIGTSTSYWSQLFVISAFVNYLQPYKSNADIYSFANLDPVTNNTLSLGNSSKYWGSAYITSASVSTLSVANTIVGTTTTLRPWYQSNVSSSYGIQGIGNNVSSLIYVWQVNSYAGILPLTYDNAGHWTNPTGNPLYFMVTLTVCWDYNTTGNRSISLVNTSTGVTFAEQRATAMAGGWGNNQNCSGMVVLAAGQSFGAYCMQTCGITLNVLTAGGETQICIYQL